MVPFEFLLWSADDCANYFSISKDYFLRKKRNQPGFPNPVSEDNEQPRWSAKSVAAWAVKSPVEHLRPATTGRLDQELVCLFGRDTVQEAISTDPAILQLSPALMDSVYNAADDLLAHPDKPATQRGIVSALEPLTRLVLCMWLQDLNLPAKLNLGSKNRGVHT